MAVEGDAEPIGDEEARWPLVRVFDSVALVLSTVVVIRALGGLLSGLEVPAVHFYPGSPSGTGLVLNHVDIAVPTSFRIQSGTAWADLVSGLLLLGGLALVTLPRIVWDVPPAGRWASAAPGLVVAVGLVALMTAVAGTIGTVNWIWNTDRLSPSTEALTVAQEVAAVILASLCSVLAWISLPYVGESEVGHG